MNKTQKPKKNIFETITGGLNKVADTISPESLVDMALGGKSHAEGDEVTKYLQNLDPANMTPEEYARKVEEARLKDEEEKAKIRSMISTVPAHMRPSQKSGEPSVFEKKAKEEENRKQQKALQEKHENLPLAEPSGKTGRGSLLGGKKRRAGTGFEGLKKDTKVG